MHNLYKLVFPNNQPKLVEKYSCICEQIENTDLSFKNILLPRTGTFTFIHTPISPSSVQVGDIFNDWASHHIYGTTVTPNPYVNVIQDFIPNSVFTELISPFGTRVHLPYRGDTITFKYYYNFPTDVADHQTFLAQNNGRLPKIQYQLDDLESCVPNTFTAIGTTLDTQYDLHQLHDNYTAMNIFTNSYQTEVFTIESGGQLDVESRVIVCEDQILTIESGGKLNLIEGEIRVNANATVIIEGDLYIDHHQKLVLEENSKLIIKNGGTLFNRGTIIVNENSSIEYHNGATLKMDRDYAEIHFNGGDLWVMQDATFRIKHLGGDNGFLRFSASGEHIFGETNSKVSLHGDGITHTILKLDKDAEFWNSSAYNLKSLHIYNAKVEMKENSRINAMHLLSLDNVNFDGEITNRGIKSFDKTIIFASTFRNVKIDAVQIYRPTAELRISSSGFNYTNLNPNTDNVIRVNGKKYKINNTTINSEVKRMIKSTNLTETSIIDKLTLNGIHVPNSNYIGIEDNSNSELIISRSNLNTLNYCVEKTNGKLKLKCNDFHHFYYSGVIVKDNCQLDLSTSSGAGYNEFNQLHTSDPDANVVFVNASQFIYLNFGNNIFDLASYHYFHGSVQMITYPNVQTGIFATRNWWGGNTGISPGSMKNNITSSITGHVIPLYSSSPEQTNCGHYDTSTPVKPAPIYNDSKAIITTEYFEKISIDDAIFEAILNTELVDSTKNDLFAIELFEEIIKFNYSDMNYNTKYFYNSGVEHLKQTLQHAFSTNKLLVTDNENTFTTYVKKYVDVLNIATDENVNEDNYRQQFNFEMDKVNLYHTLGKHTLALDIMYNMENCGLDSLEQKHVNHWKYEIETEQAKINYGYTAEFIDTVWTDTLSYIQPIKKGYGNFGSELISPNSIIFYDCSIQRQRIPNTDEVNDIEFSVYPNPSNGILNVTYNLAETSTAQVIIYTADGKLIYSMNCKQGRQHHNFDLSNVERGIYFYTYILDGIEEKRGQLVIQE